MKRFKNAGDIKVGVIGYGVAFNMGKHHINEIKKAGMHPSVVVEINKERLKSAKNDFPDIDTYTSISTMLKKSDVNLLTIITPHNTHSKIALQCLRAGKHVVCEKPFALTTTECDSMIKEAKKRKLLVTAYHNRHWDGFIMDAVDKIHSGVIGDLVRIEAHLGRWGKPLNSWRSSKSISGGILFDWGVHLLEYAFQVVDSDMIEVTSYSRSGYVLSNTKWENDAIEDESFAVIRFKNGVWVTLCMSFVDSNPKNSMLEFTGTKGTYLMRVENNELITHKKDKDIITRSANRKSESWRFYQNIADHLTKGDKLIITPEWSRRPIHVLDLANMSAKKGVAIRTKYK